VIEASPETFHVGAPIRQATEFTPHHRLTDLVQPADDSHSLDFLSKQSHYPASRA
jgi:hypothetical protein